jgi:hypothetical protein
MAETKVPTEISSIDLFAFTNDWAKPFKTFLLKDDVAVALLNIAYSQFGLSLLPVFFRKKENSWVPVKPFYQKLSQVVDSGEMLTGPAFIKTIEQDPASGDLTIHFVIDNTQDGPWGSVRKSRSVVSAVTLKVETTGDH